MVYDFKTRIARAAERLFGKQIRGTGPIYPAIGRIAQALELAETEIGDLTTTLENLDNRISALEGSSCLIVITTKVDNVATAGITVNAVSGSKTFSAVSDNQGVAVLHTAPGTYTVSGVFDSSIYYDITTTSITVREHEKKTGNVTAKLIVLSTVSVKTAPTKTTYAVGEAFDPAGTVLLATYSDASTEDISSGYTYSPTTAFDSTGEKTITYTYSEKTCTTTVTVSGE